LERPLAFIDIETTGLRPYSDKIVELSILKIHPNGKEEYKSHRVNPGIPIPAETTAIHGITDDDVANEPMFQQYAKSVRDFLEDCDIAGFSVIQFDLPCLEAEFARANIEFSRRGRQLVDSKIIYHQRDPRDLQAAYQKYCGKDLVNVHNAEEDAKASAEILEGQLEMHEDLPRDVSGLCALCYKIQDNWVDSEGKFIWVEDEAVCNFGKHEGQLLKDIAAEYPDYLEWIIRKDFSVEVKQIAANAKEGIFPQLP
jgi:DNA polymerase-3 subunit epsilon